MTVRMAMPMTTMMALESHKVGDGDANEGKKMESWKNEADEVGVAFDAGGASRLQLVAPESIARIAIENSSGPLKACSKEGQGASSGPGPARTHRAYLDDVTRRVHTPAGTFPHTAAGFVIASPPLQSLRGTCTTHHHRRIARLDDLASADPPSAVDYLSVGQQCGSLAMILMAVVAGMSLDDVKWPPIPPPAERRLKISKSHGDTTNGKKHKSSTETSTTLLFGDRVDFDQDTLQALAHYRHDRTTFGHKLNPPPSGGENYPSRDKDARNHRDSGDKFRVSRLFPGLQLRNHTSGDIPEPAKNKNPDQLEDNKPDTVCKISASILLV
ncbi:hypothetical protein B0T19DRAFT_403142 [Cercophora scortea]|uniref:Uncharacterized protein n=1 Tax=Cercophora scortea TaxID=314031 RepID=A0AAE0M5S0_9PEZI|nr:hypothetical protein B0T19DRAFT_403142 [Cercophora scortea]